MDARVLLIPVLLATASCGSEPAGQETLDEAAESFVRLALQMRPHDPDYVDAYIGPGEWATHAEQNPLTKEQLAAEVAALYARLQDMPAGEGESTIRHKALLRNVRAMDTRIRMASGERFSFAEEARRIYDVDLPDYDFARFDAALEEIEALFPGDGDLAGRVDAFMESFAVPDDAVGAVVNLAIEECRQRTLRHIRLPASEGFELEYVTNVNWGGYNWYQGDNTSLMQINRDFSILTAGFRGTRPSNSGGATA